MGTILKKGYFAEMDTNQAALNEMLGNIQMSKVTLLYAAKDPAGNHAVALKEYLDTAYRSEATHMASRPA